MIIYKDIEHERLGDAPFIGALIIAAQCSRNCPGCFNQHVKEEPNRFATAQQIISMVQDNPLNEGIILAGLEWSEQPADLVELVKVARCENLQVIVYTSCTEEEFFQIVPELQGMSIYVKFGAYVEELKHDAHFSYGVKLATTNQYIKYLGGSENDRS